MSVTTTSGEQRTNSCGGARRRRGTASLWLALVALLLMLAPAGAALLAQAEQPVAPSASKEAADRAEQSDSPRGAAEASLILRGTAPSTQINGGEPTDESLATYWNRYLVAPSSINRSADEPCGNGESFSWQLAWDENNSGRVHTGELTFDSPVAYGTEANRTVHATLFKPAPARKQSVEGEGDGDGEVEPLKTIVLLHHLEDDQRAEKLIANYFAMRGYLAVLMYFPHYGPRSADGRPDDQEMMRALIGADFPKVAQAVWDVHRLRDWLWAQEFVDNDEISLLGISLGGIMASLSAGVDPGFTRYIFVLAGGDLARVIFNDSNETRWLLEQVREEGLSEEDLRERVRPIDPCTFANRIPAERVLMFNTLEDEVIPRDSTDSLIEAINGEPLVHWFPGDHTALAARFVELLARSSQFLQQPVEDNNNQQDGDEDE